MCSIVTFEAIIMTSVNLCILNLIMVGYCKLIEFGTSSAPVVVSLFLSNSVFYSAGSFSFSRFEPTCRATCKSKAIRKAVFGARSIITSRAGTYFAI